MDLILFGVQGSGKGTQARKLAQALGLTIFETGRELRLLAKEATELGQKVRKITESGQLVSDAVVLEIVRSFLQKNSGGVIFDGIPRSRQQWILLEEECKKGKRRSLALALVLDSKIALERLLERKTCSNCGQIFGAADKLQSYLCPACGGELKVRVDDQAAAIRTRIEIYERETKPLLKEYAAAGRLIEVPAKQAVEAVTAEILTRLREFENH